MKKTKGLTLLSMSIASSFAMANYVIVVSEDYDAVKGYDDVVVGEWTDKGSKSCSNDIEQSEKYYGKTFTQTETCNQDQERTKETYYVDHNGNRTLKETEVETKILVTNTTTTPQGTHVENDCEDILSNGYSLGSDYYRVGFNNTDVYCDMVNNGGGWMRLTNYDFAENPNNTPPGLVKTVNRTLTKYTGHPYTLRDGWYRPDVISPSSSSFIWKEVDAPTNGFAWTQARIEITPLFEITPDSYNLPPTSRDSTTVNGQFVDGISVTYGNQGSRKSIKSLSRTTSGLTRSGLEWLVNSGDYIVSDNPDGSGSQLPQTFLSRKVSPTTEKISARLMLNQDYTDEKVGITKFKVWVK